MGVLLVVTVAIIIYNIFLVKYYKKKEIHFSKWFIVGLYVFAYYLGIMFEVTGPATLIDIDKGMRGSINLIPFKELIEQKDVMINMFGLTANAILFMPLGLLLPLLWEKFDKFSNTVLVGFLLSLTIEIFQLLTIRATDIDDLIMNTLGTAIGYMIYCLLFKKIALKIKLKGHDISKSLIKYDAQLFICLMFGLYFFIVPFVDRLLYKIIFGI